MARYADELDKRDVRFLQGYPSALVLYASYRLRTAGRRDA